MIVEADLTMDLSYHRGVPTGDTLDMFRHAGPKVIARSLVLNRNTQAMESSMLEALSQRPCETLTNITQ